MTVPLGDFESLVADALGRSTSLSSVIPLRVRLAARWIERNYTFQYMKQWKTLTVDPDAEYPYIVSLHGLSVKKIELLRVRTVGDDGSILYGRPLTPVSPADRESRPTGVPESYWLNGVSSLLLNSVPDEALTLEGHMVLLSEWGSASSWTHWLLDNATELLLARTLLSMAVRTRDPKLYQMYEEELKKEIQSFTVAEEDLQSQPVTATWEPMEDPFTDDTVRRITNVT